MEELDGCSSIFSRICSVIMIFPLKMESGKGVRICKRTQSKHQLPTSSAVCQPIIVDSDSDSEIFGSVVPKVTKVLEITVEFKDVKILESFVIAVKGLILSSLQIC